MGNEEKQGERGRKEVHGRTKKRGGRVVGDGI